MRKVILFALTLLLLSQAANSAELRHGVSFDMPDGLKELNPCKLPSSDQRISPIAVFFNDEGLKLQFYLLNDKMFPKNTELTLDLKQTFGSEHKKVIRDGANFGEYFSFIEVSSNSSEDSGFATYFSRERNGWRLMLEVDFIGNDQKQKIIHVLKTLEFQDDFGSVKSTNQNMSTWSNPNFIPGCDEGNEPNIIFEQPMAYPIEANLKGYEANIEVEFDIDKKGFVTEIRYEEDSWKVDYFKESINNYLKNARFQVKLEDGKSVPQKNIKRGYNFEVEPSSRKRRR